MRLRPPAPPLPVVEYDPVDWPQVIEDLRAGGLSHEAIARAVGVAKSTLMGWRKVGHEPRHCDGEALLAFWQRKVGGTVPRHLKP